MDFNAESRPLGVAIIGVGFMGKTHLAAYQSAAAEGYPCRIMALCDARPGAFDQVVSGNLALTTAAAGGEIRRVSNPADILADPDVHLVSICTPTDSHVQLALDAIAARKHVLIEKPIAIDSNSVEKAARAAERAQAQTGGEGLRVMPAMCMRFWPGWTWLKDRVVEQTFGRVVSARFERLGCRPPWSAGFYDNEARSGGALFDLHIHDADFISYCFGPPASVSAVGSTTQVTTHYRIPGGPSDVSATGGWGQAEGFAFRMRFLVNFEHATADFDLARPSPLILTHGGRSEAVPLASGAGYDGQVRHIIDCIREPKLALRATLSEAVAVTRLLEAERRSLTERSWVDI